MEPFEDDQSYYSFKSILKRSPDDLKDAVLVIVGALVAIFWPENVTPEQMVLGGGALLAFLRLVYVGPARAAKSDEQALKGIELGRQLGRQRPLQAEE